MLANGAKETTATTGTGTVTLSAVTGFPRFSQVLSVGQFVDYAIQDGNNWEWGVGKVAASNTLERTLITAKFDGGTYSKNPATGLSLSGSATVFCTPSADTFGTSLGGNTASTRGPGWVWSTHHMFNSVGALSPQPIDVNTLSWIPFVWPVGAPRFATGVSFQVTTAGGTKARVGIVELSDTAAGHRLVAQTDDMDTSTTGIKTHTFSAPIHLPLGSYATVIIADGGPSLGGSQGVVPGAQLCQNPANLSPRTRWINGSSNSGWTSITDAMVKATNTASSDALRSHVIVLRQD